MSQLVTDAENQARSELEAQITDRKKQIVLEKKSQYEQEVAQAQARLDDANQAFSELFPTDQAEG